MQRRSLREVRKAVHSRACVHPEFTALALKLWPSQLPYLLPATRETAGVSSGETLKLMHANT